MKLIFVRHGETDWNVQKKIQGSTDIDLNDLGLTQAESLGRQLQHMELQVSKIYCSKLLRARKTAAIISDKLNIPFEILEGIEEMDLGEWEGKSWKTIPKLYPEKYATWHEARRYTKTPGGESYQDVIERVVPALKKVIEREKQDVLVITHSAIIMTLLSYIHETPFHEMAKRYKVGNGGMVTIEDETIRKLSI